MINIEGTSSISHKNICRFICPIARACFDVGVRRKILEKGYKIDDENCMLSLSNNVVRDIQDAFRVYWTFVELNDPKRRVGAGKTGEMKRNDITYSSKN